MSSSYEDTLYDEHLPSIEGFTFDSKVAEVFENMVNRSVPGYGLNLAMVRLITDRYAQPESFLYDLGCSLGAATLMMRKSVEGKDCRIFSVDNSPAMLHKCNLKIQQDTSATPVNLICADISNIAITNASMVVLNFTLQFIPIERRQALLEHIYAGMRPNAVLLLSEKILFENTKENETLVELHHDFKRAQGYSDLEVSQKRAALENVLIPEMLTSHVNRLKKAGFSCVFPWYQVLNFASLIAIK